MNGRKTTLRCPLVANDWPTQTYGDGTVVERQPADPARCWGRYSLPPVSSRPYDPADPATGETEHDCPLDNRRQCPHWAERMEGLGTRYGVPPRSRNATLEDIPEDIADDVIAYLGSVERNVQDGVNVIIAGPVGAGKTAAAGLVLIAYVRLAGTGAVRSIGARALFELLETVPPEHA